MKSRNIQEAPKGGGLQPIRVDGLPYKDNMTKNIVCHYIGIHAKKFSGDMSDHIEVGYYIEKVHSDGTIEGVIPKMGYIVKDKGALVNYDLYDETLFALEDIAIAETEGYTISKDASGMVIGISYIDGQIEGQDENGDSIMEDNVIVVDPFQRKGDINYNTRNVISPAFEPLAVWESMMGGLIRPAALARILFDNNYEYIP